MLYQAYEKYKRKYGNNAQMIKAIEELAELQMALSKHLNHQGDIENIIEEIADVEIMTAQLKYIFDCHDKVEIWKDIKIKRMLDAPKY